MTPLTDAQVAALANEVHDAPVTWEGHTFTFMFTGREPIRRHVRATEVQSLALEVHQARGRACMNCLYWGPLRDQSGVRAGMGECQQNHETYCGWVPEDWQCGDFTPKEKANGRREE